MNPEDLTLQLQEMAGNAAETISHKLTEVAQRAVEGVGDASMGDVLETVSDAVFEVLDIFSE